jgi:hypothetical protein
VVVRDTAEAEYAICSNTRDKSIMQAGFAASRSSSKRKVIVQYIGFLEECWSAEKMVAVKRVAKGMSGHVGR